jgi:hypothetical protein
MIIGLHRRCARDPIRSLVDSPLKSSLIVGRLTRLYVVVGLVLSFLQSNLPSVPPSSWPCR